jgi:hypothetical protein
MAKTYSGQVSIVRNTKGEVTLKADATGQYSNEDAKACHSKMVELAKKLKTTARVFKPEADCVDPVILTGSYGQPYMALLKAKNPGSTRGKVEKLA